MKPSVAYAAMNTNILDTLRLTFLALFCIASPLPARTWTSQDGRTLEADFVSATDTTVTLKKAAGKPFTLELNKLSAADQEFVKTQAAAPRPAAGGAAPPEAATAIAGPYAAHITGEWSQVEGKDGLQGMLFGAKDLDAKKKYPLLIYLHGKGNRVLTKEHLGFAAACAKPENYKDRPCFIYAPQCPDEKGFDGETGVRLIKTIKDILKTLPVDPDRVYLTGYSMGANGTYDMLTAEPRLFAAAVPIAGAAAPGVEKSLRRIPVWIWHGEKDASVPVSYSRTLAEALKNVKTAKYTEIPGAGHDIWSNVENNAEVHAWIFAQKRGR